MRKALIAGASSLALTVAAATAVAVPSAKAHDTVEPTADHPYCISAAHFGVLTDWACGETEGGVQYLRCVAATPFLGPLACLGHGSAGVGTDYRYGAAGDSGFPAGKP